VKPWLCKAGVQLREQIDDWFPDRDRSSDGTLGDARHALEKSDHNPDATSKPAGVIRAFDCDADLSKQKGLSVYLADQIRECAKSDPRIAYVIHKGQIASPKARWIWRDYKGINRHDHHIHISFTQKGDQDGTYFQVPLIGGKI
jgi:hypothetical protein